MSQTLTDLFEASGTNSVVWQGRQVMALVEIPVGPGDRIRVRRLGSSLVRAQAIKLAVDRGALTVGGYSGPVVALWSHTAPGDLLLDVDGPATAIQLWNAWSLDGVDNSWLGNAGIMVDDHGGGLTLQCSDGVGEPDFSDLVVWVSVTSTRPVAETESKIEPAPKRKGAPRTSPINKTSSAPTERLRPSEARSGSDQTDASGGDSQDNSQSVAPTTPQSDRDRNERSRSQADEEPPRQASPSDEEPSPAPSRPVPSAPVPSSPPVSSPRDAASPPANTVATTNDNTVATTNDNTVATTNDNTVATTNDNTVADTEPSEPTGEDTDPATS